MSGRTLNVSTTDIAPRPKQLQTKGLQILTFLFQKKKREIHLSPTHHPTVITWLDQIKDLGGFFSYTSLIPFSPNPSSQPQSVPPLLSLFWVQKGTLICFLLTTTSAGRAHLILLCQLNFHLSIYFFSKMSMSLTHCCHLVFLVIESCAFFEKFLC